MITIKEKDIIYFYQKYIEGKATKSLISIIEKLKNKEIDLVIQILCLLKLDFI